VVPDPIGAPVIGESRADTEAEVATPGTPVGRDTLDGPARFGWVSPFRVIAAAVLVAAALIGWQTTGSASPSFRTARVGTGAVEATLDSVGTITPVDQADLSFNESGTVGTVDVSVGENVSTGETLASLETAPLTSAVVADKATLAAAKATLAIDESSQTSASSAAATTTTAAATSVAAASTTPTTVATSTSGASSQNQQKIKQLQAVLVADQTQEDADASAATAGLEQAKVACYTTSPTTTSSTTSTTAPTTSTTAAGGSTSARCTTVLEQASTIQAAVTADIRKVAKDENALNAALESATSSQASTATGTGASSSPGGANTSSSSSAAASSSASPSSASSGSSSNPVGTSTASSTKKTITSEQLAVDQSSIDVAEAALTEAQQALGGATLVSSIAGTVASVSIASGDSVTSGSSSNSQIVVIGSGSSYSVATEVAVADVGKVAVGQQALVTPDSTNSVLSGTVTSVGVSASSASSATYPVTITVDSAKLGQLSGSAANVAIIVKRSVDVMTVPSSAIQTIGSTHLVTVIENNATKTVRVALGTVGDVLTQVTSGVKDGDLIMLANLNEAVPSSSTTSSASGFGRASLSGGSFPGGSFPGGSSPGGGSGG
jgi:multidrug efflux pump subunit AcrA (membrane-fusion protein)